jgi:hypothetical protein
VAYGVVAILLGGVLGLAAGGRLRNLGERRLAAWPLLFAGVFLQVLSNIPDGRLSVVLLVASYASLLLFALANARLFGMALVVAGLACNLLVIAANHGMPVRPAAVIDAGIVDRPEELADIRLQAKHHFERPSDRLMLLADVIPVRPLREVLSIGDVVMSFGIAAVVAALMRKGSAHPQPQPTRSLPSER